MCCGSVRFFFLNLFTESCTLTCDSVCMCWDLCLFFWATYLPFSVLTAGSVPHAEGGDGENCHSAHQRQRKPH